MHLGGSLEYQYATASSREMIRDWVRVALSPSTEAMAALKHLRNLRGSVLSWYLGDRVAQYCEGQGVRCWWLASRLLGSMIPRCGRGGSDGWNNWLCGMGGGGG
jgi:hypothetical protein